MGNTITMNPQKADSKEPIQKTDLSDKELFDKIFEKSRDIYSKNKLQIGDKDLYNKLVINYSNQLYKLPLEKVKTIYNQIEGQTSPFKNELTPELELSLKYDGLEEEKYIVNQLTGKLVENFKDKKIPTEVERNGIRLKLPDLYYIHNKVLLLLDGIQKRENTKLEQQNGGVLFSPLALSNDGQIPIEDMKYAHLNNKMNNKNKRGGDGLMNNNNNNNTYNGNINNINSINNNSNNPNQNKGKKELNIRPPPQNEKIYPVKLNKLSSIENQLKKLEETNIKSTNKKINSSISNKNKKMIQTLTVEQKSKPNNSRSKQIIVPEEDNLCVDPTVPCKLTKMEMCVKIVMNLMTRNNIILAILSTIPIKNKNGDYEGSLTFDRLTSLKKGRFCAPSPLLHIQDEESHVRIEKIMKFLNMMDDNVCKKAGGVIFEINEKQMKDMLEDKEFGQKYFEYGNKINTIYKESIKDLLTILEKLESNNIIRTEELNQLSTSVKNIIDELYIKTQLNFLLAIMVVMDFDFKKNPIKDAKIEQRKKQIISGIF